MDHGSAPAPALCCHHFKILGLSGPAHASHFGATSPSQLPGCEPHLCRSCLQQWVQGRQAGSRAGSTNSSQELPLQGLQGNGVCHRPNLACGPDLPTPTLNESFVSDMISIYIYKKFLDRYRYSTCSLWLLVFT